VEGPYLLRGRLARLLLAGLGTLSSLSLSSLVAFLTFNLYERWAHRLSASLGGPLPGPTAEVVIAGALTIAVPLLVGVLFAYWTARFLRLPPAYVLVPTCAVLGFAVYPLVWYWSFTNTCALGYSFPIAGMAC
jgi:hypothetical protein